ncbi:MAG: hypothetical protein ACRBFS_00810 [Aureispira sp.]
MMKSLYKWHHRLGLLVTLPILGWCISGLTHPIMANFFKIRPAHRTIEVQAPQLDSTALPLKDILERQEIQSFQQVRWMRYGGQPYYQIIQPKQTAVYLHQETGAVLEEGDKVYAQALARHFLGDSSSAIVGIERIEQFTGEYRFINRFLPVYKVSFDRADGMDVYVSTESSRLGTMNNNLRKNSMAIFGALHNWDFLQAWPNTKTGLMMLFMLLGFLTAVSGLWIYGVQWKHFSEKRPNARHRRWHRRLGLMVAISTLAFTFSGGYHAFAKTQQEQPQVVPPPMYRPADVVQLPVLKVKFADRPVGNVSLVKIEEETFFQIQWLLQHEPTGYFNAKDLQRISQGDEQYALAQSKLYTRLPDDLVVNTEPIVKFGGEYGFINKRLPVRKVTYRTPEKHTVYIETSTGAVAAVIQNSKRLEALSFLMLHKYHFLDTPLGKKGRDVVIVLVVLAIMGVHLLGVVLWWRHRKKQV